MQQSGAVFERNVAAAKRRSFNDSRRSLLGMWGGVARGRDSVELPMTSADKATARASSGPIRSLITERRTEGLARAEDIDPDLARAFAARLKAEGLHGEHPLHLPPASVLPAPRPPRPCRP